jgi:hypothetical protein
MYSVPKSFLAGIALVVFLSMLTAPAQGAVLGTYSDRTTWQSAVSGLTDINFESIGLGVGGFTNFSTAAGYTESGASITGWTGSAHFLYALNPPLGAPEDFASSTVLKGPEWWPGSFLQIALPGGMTAFGIDLMTFNPNAAQLVLDLAGIGTYTINTASRPTRTFFGIRTDTPISTIQITVNSGTPFTTQALIDNVSFANAAAGGAGGGGGGAPEPSPEVGSLLLIGSGLVLLRYWKRREPAPIPV